jgi:hypothetical protein
MDCIDRARIPVTDRDREIGRLAAQQAAVPFDLERGPLIRATLIRFSDDDFGLIVTMHHLISDGSSMNLFFRDLAVIYSAQSGTPSAVLPALPFQYRDFAVWQRLVEANTLGHEIAYWRTRLAKRPNAVELPTDRPRAVTQSLRASQISTAISGKLTGALIALSESNSVTLFMTLLAALNVLLHHYTGQSDIIVASPIAGRHDPHVKNLIGFFVNTLALRTDLSKNPSFRTLMRRVRRVSLEAFEHQSLHIAQIEKILGVDLRFPIMFSFENKPATAEPFVLPHATGRFVELELASLGRRELSVFACQTRKDLLFRAVYSTDLFDAPRIHRMLAQYKRLLAIVVDSPDTSLSALSASMASVPPRMRPTKTHPSDLKL